MGTETSSRCKEIRRAYKIYKKKLSASQTVDSTQSGIKLQPNSTKSHQSSKRSSVKRIRNNRKRFKRFKSNQT
jgi:hypothetical protein